MKMAAFCTYGEIARAHGLVGVDNQALAVLAVS